MSRRDYTVYIQYTVGGFVRCSYFNLCFTLSGCRDLNPRAIGVIRKSNSRHYLSQVWRRFALGFELQMVSLQPDVLPTSYCTYTPSFTHFNIAPFPVEYYYADIYIRWHVNLTESLISCTRIYTLKRHIQKNGILKLHILFSKTVFWNVKV